ncbi:MAG: 2-dehydropantoate 2-reductase [Alphaproteobacteria bacterium]
MEELVIWGAGAIGGTVGAALARAGKNPLLVDAAEDHVGAMNSRGLKITGPHEDYTTPVRAMTPDEVRGPLRRVMLAVKSQHTRDAARAIAPLLAPDASVLSMQNGLNGDAIANELGSERVLLALVDIASDYIEPSVIHYGGRGSIYVGEPNGSMTSRVDDYVALLKHFDERIEASDNVAGFLWGKIAYGGLLTATALTNDTMSDVLGDPRWHGVMGKIGREIVLAARAAGVTPVGVDGFDAEAFARGDERKIAASCDAMAAHYRHSAKTRSGIWRDLAVRKRKTEVGPLLAPVIAAGRRSGVATPVTEGLCAMIAEMEAGKRGFSPENLAELDRS